ncbi:HNH endonuclease [Streptomyces sp. NPDC088131]|uniref:HNH endonuclease n=1 Tax=Streptomyces sp. NPDC088131 TaxID=3365826 RepID=UPI003824FBA9
MTISILSRRILWCNSGGRCAICRAELVIPSKSGRDDPSVVAEEAHIVAQSPLGPRGDHNYVGDLDHHVNLILLCRIHHKMIDDQVNEWTIDKLKDTKKGHEAWVAERLRESPQSVKLIPDPDAPNPSDIRYDLIVSGNDLWQILQSASSWRFSYSEEGSEEEVNEIVEILDSLSDWADISSEITSLRHQRSTAQTIGEMINRAAELGYVIYARKLRLLLTGGIYPEPSQWTQVEVFAPRATVLFDQLADHSPHNASKGDQGKTS